jgi:uncharacterized cupin superfamily protein
VLGNARRWVRDLVAAEALEGQARARPQTGRGGVGRGNGEPGDVFVFRDGSVVLWSLTPLVRSTAPVP